MTRLLTITAAAIGLLAAPALAGNLIDSHPHHNMKDVIVHPPTSAHGPHVASTHVKYNDVDASTPEGAKVVLSRIKAAAKKVCAPAPKGKRPMQETVDYKNCLKDATEEGVKGVNEPAVTAAYQAKA
jgi:UrcA family protein